MAVAWWSAFTLLTPLAARHSVGVLVLCRVLMGAGEGLAFPALYDILSRWAPPSERARSFAAVQLGVKAGTVLALALCPPIIEAVGWPVRACYPWSPYAPRPPFPTPPASVPPRSILPFVPSPKDPTPSLFPLSCRSSFRNCHGVSLVWGGGHVAASLLRPLCLRPKIRSQAVFYGFGALGFIWNGAWMLFMAGVVPPVDYHHVTGKEDGERPEGAVARGVTSKVAAQLLSSPSVWAIVAGHTSYNWGHYMLLSWLPTYLHEAHGVAKDALGVSTIPFASMSIGVVAWSTIADRWAQTSSVTTVRKVVSLPFLLLVTSPYALLSSACDHGSFRSTPRPNLPSNWHFRLFLASRGGPQACRMCPFAELLVALPLPCQGMTTIGLGGAALLILMLGQARSAAGVIILSSLTLAVQVPLPRVLPPPICCTRCRYDWGAKGLGRRAEVRQRGCRGTEREGVSTSARPCQAWNGSAPSSPTGLTWPEAEL